MSFALPDAPLADAPRTPYNPLKRFGKERIAVANQNCAERCKPEYIVLCRIVRIQGLQGWNVLAKEMVTSRCVESY